MGRYPSFHQVNTTVSSTNSQHCQKILKPLLMVAAFAILSLCFRFQRGSLFPSSSHPAPPTGSKLDHALSPDSIHAIHNSTLGFGEILMTNMPGRTDKLDALRLFTSVTNISYTVVLGVDGKQIPHVAWPRFYKEDLESRTGSWRTHMNAAASIIDKTSRPL